MEKPVNKKAPNDEAKQKKLHAEYAVLTTRRDHLRAKLTHLQCTIDEQVAAAMGCELPLGMGHAVLHHERAVLSDAMAETEAACLAAWNSLRAD